MGAGKTTTATCSTPSKSILGGAFVEGTEFGTGTWDVGYTDITPAETVNNQTRAAHYDVFIRNTGNQKLTVRAEVTCADTE